MLGKTEIGATEKAGARLQSKNNKWYRYIALAQMLAFAVMHLILGMYFAFVSTEYANHLGFTAKIEAHRNLDQICAVVSLVLFILDLRLFWGLKKSKKISLLYYIGMIVSAVLPLAYWYISDKVIVDAMAEILTTNYPEVIVDGVGDANWITFWTGVEYGAWANGGEITHESQEIVDYLSKIGVEAGAQVELAKFDLSGLLALFRVEMYSWNKFELYTIINAAVTVVFIVCTAIFVPVNIEEVVMFWRNLVKLLKNKLFYIGVAVVALVVALVLGLFMLFGKAPNKFHTPLDLQMKVENALSYEDYESAQLKLSNGLVDSLAKDYLDAMKQSESYDADGAKDTFQEMLEEYQNEYGEDFKHSYEILTKQELDKDQLEEVQAEIREEFEDLYQEVGEAEADDLEELAGIKKDDAEKLLKSAIDFCKKMESAKVTAGYEMEVVYSVEGSELEEPLELDKTTVNVYKVNGRWVTLDSLDIEMF